MSAVLAQSEILFTGGSGLLGQAMRLIDMCRFQADHDDHHMVDIQRLVTGPA